MNSNHVKAAAQQVEGKAQKALGDEQEALKPGPADTSVRRP